jgi:hypothetical protein
MDYPTTVYDRDNLYAKIWAELTHIIAYRQGYLVSPWQKHAER